MWKYIARSAIGIGHQKLNLPCQDYAGCELKGQYLIGVVADGAGSARFSELGSRSVVRAALRFLTNHEMEFESRGKTIWGNIKKLLNTELNWKLLNTDVTQLIKPDNQVSIEDEVKAYFQNLLQECIADLRREAQQNNCDVKDLASTLLVFIAHTNWLVAMQVGDGLLVVRERDESDYRLIIKPRRGEFANETIFVTSDGAIDSIQTAIVNKPCAFICAATDGVENVAVRLSDWSPFAPFFLPLEEYLRETDKPEEDDRYLMDFLNSDRLNARTDDDKTLLIALNYDSTN
jgi:hypothetical protein